MEAFVQGLHSVPRLLWALGTAWLCTAWSFLLIGADNIGWSAPYGAWTEGFTFFPRWSQAWFGILGTPVVLASLIGLGVAAVAGGWPVVRRIAGATSLAMIASTVVVEAIIWL